MTVRFCTFRGQIHTCTKQKRTAQASVFAVQCGKSCMKDVMFGSPYSVVSERSSSNFSISDSIFSDTGSVFSAKSCFSNTTAK